MSAEHHRKTARKSIAVALLTVSDSRTRETDGGGQLIADLLAAANHQMVDREIVPDEPMLIAGVVQQWVQNPTIEAVLLTGGTGIAPRDWTYETIDSLLTKRLPGYGELFRMLSYEQIGAAAMLSRAVAGVCESTVVMTMPGSTAAVRLAMEKLILPELAHLVHEANKT